MTYPRWAATMDTKPKPAPSSHTRLSVQSKGAETPERSRNPNPVHTSFAFRVCLATLGVQYFIFLKRLDIWQVKIYSKQARYLPRSWDVAIGIPRVQRRLATLRLQPRRPLPHIFVPSLLKDRGRQTRTSLCAREGHGAGKGCTRRGQCYFRWWRYSPRQKGP